MLDYGALAALAAVIREGSFERAAAALGVTPSAVSQRVRALEERVGATLVTRSQPPVATEAGARLCAHAEQVRLLEAEAAAALPGLGGAGAETGPPSLRIAVNADSLATWFPAAAAQFHAATGALLDIVLDDEGHTAARLRSGEALAAVTADPVPAPGCRVQRLGGLRYVAVARPDFARRWFAEGVTPATLSRAPVLRFDRRDRLQARWAARLGAELEDAPTHFAPTTQAFLDLTLAGMGWAMNPLTLAAPHLAAGRLVEIVPGARIDVELHWQRARLKARHLDALTRAALAAARAALTGPGAAG
jgi:LysR family transcriptional regulator (chromosome initiation inhibitor)